MPHILPINEGFGAPKYFKLGHICSSSPPAKVTRCTNQDEIWQGIVLPAKFLPGWWKILGMGVRKIQDWLCAHPFSFAVTQHCCWFPIRLNFAYFEYTAERVLWRHGLCTNKVIQAGRSHSTKSRVSVAGSAVSLFIAVSAGEKEGLEF